MRNTSTYDEPPEGAQALLGPDQSAGDDDIPIRHEKRRARGHFCGWATMLVICCASVLILTGFVLSNMTLQQTAMVNSPATPGEHSHGDTSAGEAHHDDDHNDDHHDDEHDDDHHDDDHDEGHNDENHDDDHGDEHHDDDHHDDEHNDDHEEANEDNHEDSHEESHDVQEQKTFSVSDQLDLRTNFVISSDTATRDYVFNITRQTYSPDGIEKSMILVNNQFPGPLIEANTGDTIRVTVNNMLGEDSTTIHWHGIDQRNSTWMDGVHGLSQCAIPPGESFLYEFTLSEQRGTFWYHAHVSTQLADGLFGPLIIHDPSEQLPKVDDDKIVLIGDLYREDSKQLASDYLGTNHPWSGMPGMEPPPDNIILNGKHMSNCTNHSPGSHSVSLKAGSALPMDCAAGSVYTTEVEEGHNVRLRLISHSTNFAFWFSIDNHTMEMVEIDGVEIEPIATTRVFINPGQRYSVVVAANQTAGNYYTRATAVTGCFHLPHAGTESLESIDFEARGILSYKGVDAKADPVGKPWRLTATRIPRIGHEPWTNSCGDLPFDRAKPTRQIDAYEVGARNYHYFEFRRSKVDSTMRTYVNESIYQTLTDDALLWRVEKQDLSPQNIDAELPVWDFGDTQTVLVSRDADYGAQIVINAKAMMMHPFHLHGQNFQVVGWGGGEFGEGTTWNLKNPMRRDTVTMNGHDHIVLRVRGDNPGIWALHCHILWHAEEGMFVSFAQRLNELNDMLAALKPGEGQQALQGRFCAK